MNKPESTETAEVHFSPGLVLVLAAILLFSPLIIAFAACGSLLQKREPRRRARSPHSLTRRGGTFVPVIVSVPLLVSNYVNSQHHSPIHPHRARVFEFAAAEREYLVAPTRGKPRGFCH